MALAGFVGVETFSLDVRASYTHEAWRGRIRAGASVAASLDPDKVWNFDEDLEKLLQNNLPEDPLQAREPPAAWA